MMAGLEPLRAQCQTLHGFVKAFWPIVEPGTPFVDGWAIEVVAQHLEAVTAGRIKRLLINIPPGMMKSLLVGVFWPAWEWAMAPNAGQRTRGRSSLRYLTTSYSGVNVIRDNNKMRRVVESEPYRKLFPAIRPSKKWGEKKFDNTATGGRDGRPISKLTGGRGDRLLVDDPHDTEGAESDVQRAKTTRIFRESLSDRLNSMENSAVVVIMQRLHMKDVSGTLLDLNTIEGVLPFTHLCLPMEFEAERRCITHLDNGELFFEDPRETEGELLFPQRFSQVVVNSLKIVKGAYAYAGQYQQRPAPRSGAIFEVDKINIIKVLPAGIRKTVRAWDFGATEAKQGKDPDFTASVKLSRDSYGFVYIEHVKQARIKGNEVRKLVIKTAQEDGGDVFVRFPQDPGAAGKMLAEDYARALSGFRFHFEPVTGAKDVRATPIANQIEAGNVYMLEADWNQDFLDQIAVFPAGKHDDMCLVAGTMVTTFGGPKPIEAVEAGDMVWTRAGYQRVLWAGQTGSSVPVTTALMSNGKKLTGTGNHPVWIDGRGFIPLDATADAGYLAACPDELTRPTLKQSRSTALHSGDTPSHPSSITADIIRLVALTSRAAWNLSIEKYGSLSTGLFRPAAISTTTMRISSITTRPTLFAGRSLTTALTMALPALTQPNLSGPTWIASATSRRRGTPPQRASNGIAGMGSRHFKSANLSPSSALAAAQPSPPSDLERSARMVAASVQTPAPRSTSALKAATAFLSAAFSVAANLWGAQGSKPARVRVVQIFDGQERADVFNLKIDGQPEFYANGVLVHNCDALADAFNQLAAVIPGEGLMEYYRQEAERVQAQLRGDRPVFSRTDLIGITGPPGSPGAYGMRGDQYVADEAGVFWVHPDDVTPITSQPGWARLPIPEEELV
jgi:predicted phage terminase large subunit-like protein